MLHTEIFLTALLFITLTVATPAQSPNARGGGNTNSNKGLTYHGGRVMPGATTTAMQAVE